jgi:N-acetylmuramoyl-L-alanine amidase
MKFTICAGHGGSDPGAVFGKFAERDLMTELRNIVSLKLRQAGHTVLNDGKNWDNLPLAAALPLIPQADLAVELHVNAGPTTAKGVESLSLPNLKPQSQRISQAIAAVLGTTVRGEKGWRPQEQSARGKLAFVSRGGIIVETFFLTNEAEREAYLAKKWLVASAIVSALTEKV